MISPRSGWPLVRWSCAAAGMALSISTATAQTVGSGNEAVIEPPVAHPAETGCVVPLVKNAKFDSTTVTYSYAPPVACPGPWAAVVLKLDLGLNAGRQYDRSGLLTMAGVPLWFGTTAEPRKTIAPHWVVQKDVTGYTALYTAAQTGTLLIANYYDAADTSTITANVSLVFYPPTASFPAPVTADVVLPLPAGGGTVSLGSGSDQVKLSQTLPKNILRAVLDIYLQGQAGDEFWYTCVPTSLSTQLESCGGGAFREGLVSVDSTPAGIAPIYPWIFTGGIDPYLWQPIPGVQTFDFIPFHADLSPFAGVLSNGCVAHRRSLRFWREHLLLRHRRPAALPGQEIVGGDGQRDKQHAVGGPLAFHRPHHHRQRRQRIRHGIHLQQG